MLWWVCPRSLARGWNCILSSSSLEHSRQLLARLIQYGHSGHQSNRSSKFDEVCRQEDTRKDGIGTLSRPATPHRSYGCLGLIVIRERPFKGRTRELTKHNFSRVGYVQLIVMVRFCSTLSEFPATRRLGK
jgi:hypothetical protein